MKQLLCLLLAGCLFLGCNKDKVEDGSFSTGIITGIDVSKCYCCWGWIIEIDNVSYKFERIPSGSSFDLTNIIYPSTVKIKWRPSQTRNCSEFIDVLAISF